MAHLLISSDMEKLTLRDQLQLKLDVINLLNDKMFNDSIVLNFKHSVLKNGLIKTLIQANQTVMESTDLNISKKTQEILDLINSKYHIFADPDCDLITHRDLSWSGAFGVTVHFYQSVLENFKDHLNFLTLIDELALNFNSPFKFYEHSESRYQNNQLTSLEKKLYEFIAHFDQTNLIAFKPNQTLWQRFILALG